MCDGNLLMSGTSSEMQTRFPAVWTSGPLSPLLRPFAGSSYRGHLSDPGRFCLDCWVAKQVRRATLVDHDRYRKQILGLQLKICMSNVESIAGKRSTLITWAEAENRKMSFSNQTLKITYFDRPKPEPMVRRHGMSNFESHRFRRKKEGNVNHPSD